MRKVTAATFIFIAIIVLIFAGYAFGYFNRGFERQVMKSPADGLIFHVPFDEGAGATSFRDLNGNVVASCSGSNCPATGLLGRVNKAARFNGGNHVSAIKTELNSDMAQLSLFAWVKREREGAWERILGKFYYESAGREFGSWVVMFGDKNNSNCKLKINNAWKESASFANTIPVDNNWHSVTCVYDGSSIINYVDGKEMARTFASGKVSGSQNRINIGATSNITRVQNHFKGMIDDVRIYTRALISDEVFELYSGKPVTTCGSCSDCSSKLNGAFGKVKLSRLIPSDVSSCIKISSDNVVLDCQGNSIVCRGQEGMNAIEAIGRKNVEVRGCVLVNCGTNGGPFNGAIFFSGTNKSSIFNNTLLNQSGLKGGGIVLVHSSNNSVEYNKIFYPSYTGIDVQRGSNYNYVAFNRVEGAGHDGADPCSGVNGNIMHNNTFLYSSIKGICLCGDSGNNTVTSNTMCYNGLADIGVPDPLNSNYIKASGNTCDTTIDFNDDGKVGCTYKCPPR